MNGPYELDRRFVPRITAYLFHAGGHDDPERLAANRGKAFKGSDIYGMGFTFDDTDTSGVASSISSMHALIERNNRNAERILPFIGGEELNESPTQNHHRYIIGFGTMTEEEAGKWPDLLKIVEERVRPQRQALPDTASSKSRKEKWWQWSRATVDLYDALKGKDRTIVIAQTSNTLGFAFKEAKTAFGHTLVVFPNETFTLFSALQSRVHQIWALTFGATMKDDARYIPSDCFETFPFPENFETDRS